jgi:Uma2 family endonuclease
MSVVPLSRAARRWQEIFNDPELSQRPERIETDARGQVCQLLFEDPNLPLQPAPPICVEIVSPSNTATQMEEKRALYFASGAKEVWVCERDGKMRFFDSAGKLLIRV